MAGMYIKYIIATNKKANIFNIQAMLNINNQYAPSGNNGTKKDKYRLN